MRDEVTVAQLRLLAAFATESSISGVARLLGLSQPTVSQTVRAIESKLGRTLISRTPGGSVLTPEGRMIVEWGQGLLREAERFHELVASTASRPHGRLKIAASMTVAEYLVPHWLMKMAGMGVGRDEIELRVANSERVMSMVHSRGVDAGFVEGLQLRSGLISQKIGDDRLVVVVGSGHAWSAAAELSLDEFLAGQLLLRESGSGTREVFEQSVLAAGREIPAGVATLGSTSAIKTAVRAGDGAGVISALAVREELGSGAMREVRVSGLEMRRSLRMVRAHGAPEDPRLALLLQVARQSD